MIMFSVSNEYVMHNESIFCYLVLTAVIVIETCVNKANLNKIEQGETINYVYKDSLIGMHRNFKSMCQINS